MSDRLIYAQATCGACSMRFQQRIVVTLPIDSSMLEGALRAAREKTAMDVLRGWHAHDENGEHGGVFIAVSDHTLPPKLGIERKEQR